MTDTATIALPLIHELWTAYEHRCPYARHDDRGCYCTSPSLLAMGDPYMVCDHLSLQVWCLTEAHYTRCIFYPAGDVP